MSIEKKIDKVEREVSKNINISPSDFNKIRSESYDKCFFHIEDRHGVDVVNKFALHVLSEKRVKFFESPSFYFVVKEFMRHYKEVLRFELDYYEYEKEKRNGNEC